MSEPIFSHDQSIEIAAPPATVYALVSDMARYGEWSPLNMGGKWLDGGTGKVGDWFEGHNRMGKMEYDAKVEVTEAEEGKEFGFWTMGRAADVAHWRYSMEPSGTGTKLTEHYRLHNPPGAMAKGGEAAVKGWTDSVPGNVTKMLEGIKAAAESA
ncbi:MAG: SRPBCC family protein [Acidimicrobiia bacterium]|nr:SRPBCC family protein [Acidimicrobiia bacterium]